MVGFPLMTKKHTKFHQGETSGLKRPFYFEKGQLYHGIWLASRERFFFHPKSVPCWGKFFYPPRLHDYGGGSFSEAAGILFISLHFAGKFVVLEMIDSFHRFRLVHY